MTINFVARDSTKQRRVLSVIASQNSDLDIRARPTGVLENERERTRGGEKERERFHVRVCVCLLKKD